MHRIIAKIEKKLGNDRIVADLAEKLSASELNSLLLSVFRQRTKKQFPSELLDQFANNRFVQMANVNTLALKQLELDCLNLAVNHQFEPITLSPVAPLGACSSVGKVDQNKVVSSLRGTEVLSDATNVMALKIAQETRKNRLNHDVIQYATVHRHVRAQAFDNPNFSAHFSVFCLASGGFDRGSDQFEVEHLMRHINLHYQLLRQHFDNAQFQLKIFLREGSSVLRQRIESSLGKYLPAIRPHFEYKDQSKGYYDRVQFKIFVEVHDQKIDFSDGGCVDWTQKILSNQKHRLFISATGIELLHKLTKI